MNNKTLVRPTLGETARTNKAGADAGKRTAAGYRAKIEALFDELAAERLADLWQKLYPLPIDPDCELPDRRGIIQDLADFALVLQPGGACEMVGQAHKRLRVFSYRSSRDVRCDHRHGFVPHSARAGSHYEKQLAQKAVARLEGVVRVVNQLEVT
jgi:hypothetical protein